MDDPQLPADEHLIALEQLARLNRISRTARTLWPFVRAVAGRAPSPADGSLSVLDVATGSGDVPISLAMLARSHAPLMLHACDVSPVALAAAAKRARAAGVDLTLESRNVVADGLAQPDKSVDVVTCSLFLHHLTEVQVVHVLSEMRRVAKSLVLVSDLRRCAMGLAAAYLATRLGTRSRVVRIDAIRSVRAAFTIDELASLASRAGMPDARILPCWPFRMLLAWSAPPSPTRPAIV
jgi:2-polyprenyl-3-methyl-5-hydroxy-6-metoxy-1,4-benzoquinol methylase